MAVTKKQNAKSKTRKVAHPPYRQMYLLVMNALQRFLQKIRRFFLGIPAWVTGRPRAIRHWRKERRKKRQYRSFHLQKKIKELKPLPRAHKILKESLIFLWRNKRLFVAIASIHVLVYVFLINAPQRILSIDEIQETVNDALGEGSSQTLNGTLATLGTVIGVNASAQAGGTRAALAILLISLVYIWAIRQVSNKQDIGMRDAYYQGMAPLFPVLLILAIVALQMIPFAVAGIGYSIARTGGIFVTGFEDLAFFIIVLLMGLLSLFLITPTIIAFYIATLPGMYPMEAMRSAKKLVQFQRLAVFRRIFFLPLFLAIIYTVLLLFLIRFLPDITFYYTESFQFVALPLIHVYLYKLYRSLI